MSDDTREVIHVSEESARPLNPDQESENGRKRNFDMMAVLSTHETIIVSPARKCLKSSEQDLEIFVGPVGVVFWYHSQLLAVHSEYIDSILASPMAEGRSRKLNFPEISVDQWELMMSVLLEVPTPKLTPEQAKQIAPHFDKYCFLGGLKFCDQILADHLFETDSQDIVPHISFAKQFGLSNTLTKAIDLLQQVLGNDMGRLALSFDDLTQIVPLIKERDSLWTPIQKLLRLGQKTTKQQILKDPTVFALLFQKSANGFSDKKSLRTLNRVVRVECAGTTDLNGLYVREPRTVGSYTPYILKKGLISYAIVHRYFDSKKVDGVPASGKYWSIGIIIEDDPLTIDPFYISDYEPTSLPPRTRWMPIRAEHFPGPSICFEIPP